MYKMGFSESSWPQDISCLHYSHPLQAGGLFYTAAAGSREVIHIFLFLKIFETLLLQLNLRAPIFYVWLSGELPEFLIRCLTLFIATQ
jgi:hypothetical protein